MGTRELLPHFTAQFTNLNWYNEMIENSPIAKYVYRVSFKGGGGGFNEVEPPWKTSGRVSPLPTFAIGA